MHHNRRVAVVGSGYVGTVVAACLAALGHRVVAVEADETKVKLLAEGISPIHEPGLQTLLEEAVDAGRLTFTDSIEHAAKDLEIAFLCIGTPASADGHPDLGALEDAARALGDALEAPAIVVTKSTVPVGTNAWLGSLIDEGLGARHAQARVAMVSNPEFLRAGSAVTDFLRPDRIVIGSDDADAARRLSDVYQPIIAGDVPDVAGPGDSAAEPRLVTTSLRTAELIKYASNSFLAMKISFINELSRISDGVGADVTAIAEAMGMDSRISPHFLEAGVGWGGSCFGKDLAALAATAREHGVEPRLLDATAEVNEDQRREVVRRLQHRLGSLRGRRITLLGLAFKPETDDTRDSPAVAIARHLTDVGAIVTCHDPVVTEVPELHLRTADDPYTAATGAHALVLVTNWSGYGQLDLARLAQVMDGTLVIDGRNVLDPDAVRQHGLAYQGVGRGSAVARG